MEIAVIEGHTRTCGESQGFRGLPLRDELLHVEGMGVVNQMTSAWTPTAKELVALNAGASVHVSIWGNSPPPMIVEVGKVPE